MTSRAPSALPPPLGMVRIRKLLSPSALASGNDCPLPMMVGAPDHQGTLAPAAVALLGTVLHHVRACWRTRDNNTVSEGTAAAVAVDELLSTWLADSDRQLAADPRTSGLAPLAVAVGYEHFANRRMTLRRWAKAGVVRVDGEEPPPLRHRLFHEPAGSGEQPDRFSTGIEPWLVANALRLVGRPDLVVRLGTAAIEISDDKTGRVVDDKGRVLDHHAAQLRFYALMVEHLVPDQPVVLTVIGESGHSVAWDSQARGEALARLTDIHDRLPAGKEVDADQLATPGRSCKSCRLRPQCGAYRRAAVEWWKGEADPPKPVPFDTWGRLDSLEVTPSGISADLTDPAGRVVRIRGLAESHGLGEHLIGQRVAVFDLEPSQDVRLHGRWLAPTSWHQRSPGRTYPTARRTRVFSDLEGVS